MKKILYLLLLTSSFSFGQNPYKIGPFPIVNITATSQFNLFIPGYTTSSTFLKNTNGGLTQWVTLQQSDVQGLVPKLAAIKTSVDSLKIVTASNTGGGGGGSGGGSNGAKIYDGALYGILPASGDVTSAINTLLQTIRSAGGGVLYLKAGVYTISGAIINDCNCQIKIPSNTIGTNVGTTIQGEFVPNMTDFGQGLSPRTTQGTILLSTIIPTSTGSVIGSAPVPSFLGTFNWTSLHLENLEIRTTTTSGSNNVVGNMNGVDASNLWEITNNNLKISTTSTVYNSVMPTNETYGIIYSSVNNIYNQGNGTLMTQGYKYGIRASEHLVLTRHVAVGNVYAVRTLNAPHSATILHTDYECNVANIFMDGDMDLAIFHYDTEHVSTVSDNQGGGGTVNNKWYTFANDVVNPNNTNGILTIQMSSVGRSYVGKVNEWVPGSNTHWFVDHGPGASGSGYTGIPGGGGGGGGTPTVSTPTVSHSSITNSGAVISFSSSTPSSGVTYDVTANGVDKGIQTSPYTLTGFGAGTTVNVSVVGIASGYSNSSPGTDSFTTTGGSPTYASPYTTDQKDGLAAYYKLEETSGTFANSVGGGLVLTPNGDATRASGFILNGVTTTSTGYLAGATSSYSNTGAGFTLAGWFHIAGTTGTQCLFSKYDNTTANQEYNLTYDASGHAVGLDIWDASNTIHHIVVSGFNPSPGYDFFCIGYDPTTGNAFLQINGGSDNLVAMSAPAVGSAPFQIGQIIGILQFSGKFDEIGYWTKFKTNAQRVALYNSGYGTTY